MDKKYTDFSKYNDYELLYYAKDYNEEARRLLHWKYSFLIYTKISKFNIPSFYKDDYFQDGEIVLEKAIRLFDDNSRMRFTTFFDLLLTRKFITKLHKEGKYFKNEYREEWDDLADNEEDSSILIFNENEFNFSELEKLVYVYYYKQAWKLEEIINKFNLSAKSVYNAKQRVAKKIRTYYNA